MEKSKKNRSGSMSDRGSKEGKGEMKRVNMPGAPAKSNRQTGEGRKENMNEEERNMTRKGSNSI